MEARHDWIEGTEFPATKVELIDIADEAGVPQELIERLQRLGQEQYESREELEAELGADD
jgi:hypothetical protein